MGKEILVDSEELDYVYYELSSNANEWSENIADILTAITNFVNSDSLTGEGAKAIKDYFENVHSTIVQALTLLLQTHSQNMLMYKVDYQNNIDTATNAYIPCSELDEIKDALNMQYQNSLSVEESIGSAISKVSYLIDTPAPKLNYIEKLYSQINTDLQTLYDDISELEYRHLKTDFVETKELTDSLTSLINEYLTKDKTVKNSFDVGVMKSSAAYKALEAAKKAVVSKQLKRSNELSTAYECELAHMKRLNEVAYLKKEYKDLQNMYDNFLNEDVDSSQIENLLANYTSSIMDFFPNAKIGDEFEIPINPTLTAYYKISETLKGDIPVDLNYVVKDQQLALKNFNFSQELGLGTSIDIDSDGGFVFSNKKVVENNTYKYSYGFDLKSGSMKNECSVKTDLEKASVSSAIGIKQSNDIEWQPQPNAASEAIQKKYEFDYAWPSIDWDYSPINKNVVAGAGVGTFIILACVAVVCCA